MTDRMGRTVTPLRPGPAAGEEAPVKAHALTEARHDAPAEGEVSPFNDAAVGLVYETDALRERLDELYRAVTEGETVAVIEGEKGAGKTTFVRWFLARAGDDWEVCHIAARMALGEHHVLTRLGQTLLGEATAESARIRARLIERGRRGPFTLIVVDDAHNLSAFALKALFDLKRAVARAGGRIGVVLAARPLAVESMFDTPSLAEYRREWMTSIELPHLSEAQTGEYVRHRVEIAGLSERLSFDEHQLKAIHRGSRGVPLYINRLAKDMLSGARPRRFRTERQQHDMARRRKAFTAAAALGLSVLAVGYTLYAVAFKPSTFDMALEEAVLQGGLEASPPLASAEGPAGGAAPPAGTASPPEAAPPHPEARSAEDTAAGGQGPASPGPAASPAPLTGNDWLMAQDPEGYTIQLAGTPEADRAHQFIDKHPLSGDIMAVRTLRGNRTWYMVLYNSYPSAEAARREIAELPAAVRRNQPFARRFASVQAIAAE